MVKEHSPQKPNTPPMQEEEDENVPTDDVEIIEMDEDEELEELEDEVDLEELEERLNAPQPDFIIPTQDDSILTFEQHSKPVFCGKLEPKSGKIAITGGQDDKAFLWDVENGNIIKEFKDHEDSVVSVDFSFDGNYVASADMAGFIQVWKLSNSRCVWSTNIGDLTWIQWHHGAHILFAGNETGEIYMWKIPSGDCKVLAGQGSKCECFAIMPDGKRSAAGYGDGTIRIIDLRTMTAQHTISAHTSTVTAIDPHPDNNIITSSSTDLTIVSIKSQTGKVASTLNSSTITLDEQTCDSWVDTLKFYKNPTVNLLAAGTLDGFLIIWDFSRLIVRHVFKQPSGIVKILWKSQEVKLYTASLDGVIRLYDALQGTLIKEFHGHWSHILDIDLSCDGNKLLTASEDHTVKIFNTSVN